jgi:hypothetical protein
MLHCFMAVIVFTHPFEAVPVLRHFKPPITDRGHAAHPTRILFPALEMVFSDK